MSNAVILLITKYRACISFTILTAVYRVKQYVIVLPEYQNNERQLDTECFVS